MASLKISARRGTKPLAQLYQANRVGLFPLEQRNTSKHFIIATETPNHHFHAIIQMTDNPESSSLSFDAKGHINGRAGSLIALSKVTDGTGAHQGATAN